jgi:hypothetical protein
MTGLLTAEIFGWDPGGQGVTGSIDMEFPPSSIEAHASISTVAIFDARFPAIASVTIEKFRRRLKSGADKTVKVTAEDQSVTLWQDKCTSVTFFVMAWSAECVASTRISFFG